MDFGIRAVAETLLRVKLKSQNNYSAITNGGIDVSINLESEYNSSWKEVSFSSAVPQRNGNLSFVVGL